METQIELKVSDIDGLSGVKLVKLIGDLDATNVENVLEKVNNIKSDGFNKIIADFTKLRYVNSTGLGVLLHMSKSIKEDGGFFKIINMNDNVYEIVEIIGASTFLEIYDTMEEATESLES